MNINYKKANNINLFDNLIDNNIVDNYNNISNYIPIYNRFFNLNEKNYNKINLNNKLNLLNINKVIDENTYDCNLIDNSNNIIYSNKLFFKFTPLVDVIKYLSGKYKNHNISLPILNSFESHKDIIDNNNVAYVEGLFYYLSSNLLHNFSFINSVDFYGSYLIIKNNYIYNIADELDYLVDNKFFNDNNNKLFTCDDYYNVINYDTRNNKLRLIINKDCSDNILSNLNELNAFNNIFYIT